MNHLLFLLAVLLPYTLLAQKQARMEKNQAAEAQIRMLKNGALLVRLQTRQNVIDAMLKEGERKKAEAVRMDQQLKNKEIVRAFENEFRFCPVYYFYSHDSKWVATHQLDSVGFLDTNLTVNPSIRLEKESYLTAEFGRISEDTVAPQLMEYQVVPSETGPKRVAIYSGASSMGFGALLVKSDLFIQLRRPFPFYVRTLESLPFKRRTYKTVRMLNKKLTDYYVN